MDALFFLQLFIVLACIGIGGRMAEWDLVLGADLVLQY